MRHRASRIALAFIGGLGCWLAPALPARALDFTCIEPSRYRNLLTIFSDDANLFFSHFGLSRGKLPPIETCRALLVTGTLKDGDSRALLAAISQGGGWLATLHLAFEGTNPTEEARMATIIRAFELRTRSVRSDRHGYMPDFLVRWAPPGNPYGDSAMREDVSPLAKGFRTYQANHNLVLKVERDKARCEGGCRTLWHAGVNRLTSLDNPLPPPQGAEVAINRRRVAMVHYLEQNRLPPPQDPGLAKPLEWTFVTPNIMARRLRERCAPEASVMDAQDARWSEAFETARTKEFTPRDVAVLEQALDSVAKAGVRLQQCLAGVLEAERLRAYEQACGKGCQIDTLAETYNRQAQTLLDATQGF